jgi:hypothetical protein
MAISLPKDKDLHWPFLWILYLHSSLWLAILLKISTHWPTLQFVQMIVRLKICTYTGHPSEDLYIRWPSFWRFSHTGHPYNSYKWSSVWRFVLTLDIRLKICTYAGHPSEDFHTLAIHTIRTNDRPSEDLYLHWSSFWSYVLSVHCSSLRKHALPLAILAQAIHIICSHTGQHPKDLDLLDVLL